MNTFDGHIWKFFLSGDWDNQDMDGLMKYIKLEFQTKPIGQSLYVSQRTGRVYRFQRSGKVVYVVENSSSGHE